MFEDDSTCITFIILPTNYEPTAWERNVQDGWTTLSRATGSNCEWKDVAQVLLLYATPPEQTYASHGTCYWSCAPI